MFGLIAGLLASTNLYGAPRAVTQPDGLCLEKLANDQRQFEIVVGKNLRLISRGQRSQGVFYLASEVSQADRCGRTGKRTVFSKLELPRSKSEEWFAVGFDCSDRAKVISKGAPLIGLFSKQTRLPAKARKGWTIDKETKSFKSVEGAECRSFDQ
jgi:hypothetical protein